MSNFWAWTLTVIAFVALCLAVFGVIRATGKPRANAVRDAQAQHELGTNPRPEDQSGYVSPYRS